METEFFLLLPCNYLPIDFPSKSSQRRAGRVQKDKCSKVQQIPTPQIKELSNGSSSDNESAVFLTNLHTGQTLEEVVTEEHPHLHSQSMVYQITVIKRRRVVTTLFWKELK